MEGDWRKTKSQTVEHKTEENVQREEKGEEEEYKPAVNEKRIF